MMRVAGYCRVSTDKEDQLSSFEAQRRYFLDYIRWHENWELCAVYADCGASGTLTEKRTEFNRMMEDARRGRFHLILTKEVSRFSRNILDTIACTRELKGLGVSVHFLTDGICTADPDAELRLSIMASIAQEESRKTSTRVTWGQTRQMERGVVFGHSLLGYTVKNGRLTVEESGAAVVREIFRRYVCGKMGADTIARELTECGIPNPSGGIPWTGGTVRKILKNEKYAGDLIQKKTCTPDYLTHKKKCNRQPETMIVLKDHHDPIVSRQLWDAAQDLRQSRGTGGNSHTTRYSLSGKIRCGECGEVFISRVRKQADGTFLRKWGCGGAARGKDKCPIGLMLREDCAEEMLQTVMESLSLDCVDLKKGIGTEKCEKENLIKLKDGIRRRRERALEGYLSGLLTADELEKGKERCDREERELDRLLTKSYEDSADDILDEILSGKRTNRQFWQEILEEIRVFHDGRITVKLREYEALWVFQLE